MIATQSAPTQTVLCILLSLLSSKSFDHRVLSALEDVTFQDPEREVFWYC